MFGICECHGVDIAKCPSRRGRFAYVILGFLALASLSKSAIADEVPPIVPAHVVCKWPDKVTIELSSANSEPEIVKAIVLGQNNIISHQQYVDVATKIITQIEDMRKKYCK